MDTKEAAAKRARKRYWRLVEEGLCTKCAKEPPWKYGATKCARCSMLQKMHSINHYRNNKAVYAKRDKERQDHNRKNNCCLHCSAPLEDNYATCVNCRSRTYTIKGYSR